MRDEEKRQIYDRFGHEGLAGTGFRGFTGFEDIFSAFGDIFEGFFGFGTRTHRGTRAKQGQSLRYDLELTLEEAFYGKSVQSALRIGEGRGVAILAAGLEEIKVYQYPPATVKKAVTGSGNAHKSQVGAMVKVLLGLTEVPPEDAADALAVAICHLHRS